MELTMRTATPSERLYDAKQSAQIECQTGNIGYLRVDMGTDGNGFFKVWTGHRNSLYTEEFQAEFDSVLNSLAGDEQYGGFLKSRDSMTDFCRKHPESSFHKDTAFGFRADTEQYSYLIRLQPYQEEENLLIHCYRRDWLDRHMKHARKGVRFITPHYKEKFRVEDGDTVRITTGLGEKLDRVVRYIDDCHVEIGDNLYHIFEFAERLEHSGGSVIPLRSSLPERCFSITEAFGEVIVLTRGEAGYRLSRQPTRGKTPQECADKLNGYLGVTKAQAAAMRAGSLFGWDTPAADPKNYDEKGQPIKFKQRGRGDAR